MRRFLVGGVLVVLVCTGAASPAGGQKAAQPPAGGPKAAAPFRVEVEDLMRTHEATAPVKLTNGGEGKVEVSATAGRRRTVPGREVLFVAVGYFYPAFGGQSDVHLSSADATALLEFADNPMAGLPPAAAKGETAVRSRKWTARDVFDRERSISFTYTSADGKLSGPGGFDAKPFLTTIRAAVKDLEAFRPPAAQP